MKKILASLSILAASLVANDQFELNINNDTIEVGAEFNLNRTMDLPSDSTYTFDMRFLKTEEKEVNDEGHYLGNIGFKVIDNLDMDMGASFGLGLDLLYTNTKNDNLIAVPLTLFGKYAFNEKFFVDAKFKFSPKILTFSDGESYKEARATVNYSLTNNAIVYGGGRYIKASYENYDINFDKTVFGGFKFIF